MAKFDKSSIQEIKDKLEVELLGVVSLETCNSKELKSRATSLLPKVRSVVVVGKEIYKEVVSLLNPSKEAGEAEYGELLVPHSDYLNGQLNKVFHHLAGFFQKEGYQDLPLPAKGCPTDQRTLTAIFSYKHAGQLAGLGTIGRHSLLITPDYGPRVRLACLLTEAPLEGSFRKPKDYCIHCDACIQQCPAQAIHIPGPDEAYSMNKFACRTYRQAGLTCGMCIKACDEVLG
ncbi:MAG: 4Fe-4S dicluster domain-containing protein [Thermodesulfobacteriota bacterium]|nr:4Fe-4S dicluster domain-containing protein [Thermodesulfobacteriota bacterium]